MGHKGIPAEGGFGLPQERQVQVNLPKDAELARLMTGSGGKFERLVNGLATAAHPDHWQRTVILPAGYAGHVAEDLAALLARARAAADPAADALAAVAAQFGVVEEPGPAAVPAPKSAAAAPSLSGGSAK